MQVIPPQEIFDGLLTYSTAAEPGVGESVYNAATSYAIGDKVYLGSPSSTVTMTIASPGVVTWSANGLPDGTPVVLTTTGALPTGLTAGTVYYVVNRATGTFQLSETLDGAAITTTGSQSGTHTATAQIHRRYESQAASNTGNAPAIDDGTKWLDIGPTNRWAMLDLDRSTGTEVASPLTVVITPGQRVNAIGVVGMVADSISITVTVDGVIEYTYTEDLSARPTTTWSDYFFGTFRYKASLALFDLPPYVNGVITVTLTRTTGNVKCGGVVIGMGVYVGATLHDAESDALNFSTVSRDDYGTATLVKRRSVPKTNQRVNIAKTNVNKVLALRELLNAKPALWAGLDDTASGYFEPLLVLGVYRQFAITMDRADYATGQIEIEEI